VRVCVSAHFERLVFGPDSRSIFSVSSRSAYPRAAERDRRRATDDAIDVPALVSQGRPPECAAPKLKMNHGGDKTLVITAAFALLPCSGKDDGGITRPCTSDPVGRSGVMAAPSTLQTYNLGEHGGSPSVAPLTMLSCQPRESLERRVAHHTASPLIL
jgi:hypothetical protein